MLAILGSLLSMGAAAAAAAGGGMAWAWRASGLGQARRNVARATKPIEREARKVEKAFEPYQRAVGPAAATYAVGRTRARLEEVSIDSLRDAGAANVRWSALEEAGYNTLADVEGKPPRELARVHGIGKKSASAVAKAAKKLSKRARSVQERHRASSNGGTRR